jgi:hypothetical protein
MRFMVLPIGTHLWRGNPQQKKGGRGELLNPRSNTEFIVDYVTLAREGMLYSRYIMLALDIELLNSVTI